MKKDISLFIGLGAAFGALIIAFMMEGGNPLALFGPSALIIIVGGLFGASTISFGLPAVLKMPKSIMKALSSPPHNPVELVDMFIEFAEKARREGLLSLEEEVNSDANRKFNDPLIKKGMSMVVDGIDASAIEKIFENEINEYEERAKSEIAVLEQIGGFSPTMGIIGTVLGLISVLGNLAEPEKLGESIAVAFIATLYGISFANLIFLPTANKLKAILKGEVAIKALIMDGVIALQAGDNPRLVREKLIAYIDEKSRDKVKSLEG